MENVVVPDFAMTAVVAFLAVIHGKSSRIGTLSMVLFRLPSTILHELAHFIVGLLMGAGVSGFSLWPQKNGDHWVLGSVDCSNISMFNAFPVALAPLFVNIPLSYWCYSQRTLSGVVMSFLLLIGSVPSMTDLRVSLSSYVGAASWIFGILLGMMFWLK